MATLCLQEEAMLAEKVQDFKKILGFRWSSKAEVTLETISFWENISINIFEFSPFLSIKSYQFFKIY